MNNLKLFRFFFSTHTKLAISFPALNKADELEKLRLIYQTYAQDLSRDASHELRTKVDAIKVYFK